MLAFLLLTSMEEGLLLRKNAGWTVNLYEGSIYTFGVAAYRQILQWIFPSSCKNPHMSANSALETLARILLMFNSTSST
jgi:hypothetical protein